MADYSHFQAEDFAADDHFIRWVKSSDPAIDHFWHQWLEQHPDKKAAVAQARQLVAAVTFPEPTLTDQEVERMWHVVDTHTQEIEPKGILIPPSARWIPALRLAAGILLLITVAATVFVINHRLSNSIVLATKTSQIRTVSLPDGSMVTLNANSSVRFPSTFLKEPIREVWLEGEAFFEVKKHANATRFVVHTNEVTVEVLGTKFNVNARRQKARVVLNEGKVALRLHRQKQDSTLTMQPGDMIEYAKAGNTTSKKIVNPQTYTAWTQHRLEFHETSFQEIAEILKDTQGLDLHFQDAAMGKLVFSGSADARNIDLLWVKLAKAFHLKITRAENRVSVEYKTTTP
jgi:ferric-dicitrate binding protein FerR (iron transport regulator)